MAGRAEGVPSSRLENHHPVTLSLIVTRTPFRGLTVFRTYKKLSLSLPPTPTPHPNQVSSLAAHDASVQNGSMRARTQTLRLALGPDPKPDPDPKPNPDPPWPWPWPWP